jgi:hypothetical protein
MLAARSLRVAARGQTGHRTIAIAGTAFVLGVRGGLTVCGLRMAIDTRGVCVVCGINMAVGADRVVVWQLPEIVVVERRSQPASGIVAAGGRAIRGKARRDVVRDGAA